MFINCSRCCSNRPMVSSGRQLTITNYTDLQIYFIIQYTTRYGVTTRQSPTFGRSVSEKIYFSDTVQNLAFNIINDSSPTKDLICNKFLGDAKNFTFYVVETPTGATCVQA